MKIKEISMSKWAFKIEKTEDDFFTIIFHGKVPQRSIVIILNAIACVGCSIAVIEMIKQYVY
jgi:hypothetical protein